MPKYPYSIRPLKQSSEINLQSEKVKNTGILLRSPHLAESSIEFGLRKKIYSLKTENHNSAIIGVLTKRLSNVEKELHSIKDELKEAKALLEAKDNEIKDLKARLSIENRNDLVCNAPDKKNENLNENDKTKLVSDKDSIGSFNDDQELKVDTSMNSMQNLQDDSPSKSPSPIKTTVKKEKNKDHNCPDSQKDRKDSGSPNMIVLRPGEKKPEYKKIKGNQISNVETPENQSPTGSDLKISELELENKQLAQKVAELEKFIGEYGLMWVGDKAIGESNIESRPTSSTIPSRSTHMKSTTTIKIRQPNLDNIITVISDLNENVSEQQIVKSPLGAKFQKCDILELKLYADGMQLEQNPFRKYDTPSAEAFFKDLEDGYYPSELKSRHPQGVIFKVVDKRNIAYEEEVTVEPKPQPFSGKGVRLGEGKKTSITPKDSAATKQHKKMYAPSADKVSISSKKIPKSSYEDINEAPIKPQTKIKKIPKNAHIAEETSGEDINEAPIKPQTKIKKIPKNAHIAEETSGAGFKEHWVNKKSPPSSGKRFREKSNENPPQIDMPSIPLEINLQSRNQSPDNAVPSSFTPAVSLNTSKPRPPQNEPKQVPEQPTSTASKVFSDQAIYQQNDQDRNRAPVNITNITYHEAPVSFQLTPEDAANLPRVPVASAPSTISRTMPTHTSCKCAHEHQHPHPQTTRSPNEICPGACGQFGVIGAPKRIVLCPCGCGAQADLYIHEAPPSAHEMDNLLESRDNLVSEDNTEQDFNLTQTKLDILTKMKIVYHHDQLTKMHVFSCIDMPKGPTDEPLEPLPRMPYPAMTEYQDKISKMAFMRIHHGKEIANAVDGTPAAGKPSGFKNIKIDPHEQFEHFVYMGKPRGSIDKGTDETGVSKRKSVQTNQKYKVLELNKKTSETMISVKLHSDIKKKTYLIHLYPGDPVEKIWSILNTNGENYEMITEVDNNPIILIDRGTLEEQNVQDNADIIVRKSPHKEKRKSEISQKFVNIDKKEEKIGQIVSKHKDVEKRINRIPQNRKNSVESEDENESEKSSPKAVNKFKDTKGKNLEKRTSEVSPVSRKSVESKDENTSPDKSVKKIKKHKKFQEKPKETNLNPNDLPPLKVVSSTSNVPTETIKSSERKRAEEMLEDKYELFLAKKSKTSTPKKLSDEISEVAGQKDVKKAISEIKNSSRKVSSEPIVDKLIYDKLNSSPDKKSSPNKTEDPRRSHKGLASEAVINALKTLAEKSGSPKGLVSEPTVLTEKDGSPKDKIETISPPKGVVNEPTKISQEKSDSPKKTPSPKSAKKLENDKTVPTTEPTKLSQEKSISPKKGPGPGSKLVSDKTEPITGPTQISQENSVSPKKVPSPGSAKKFESEKTVPTTEPAQISQENSVSPKKVPSPGSAKKFESEKTEPTIELTKISKEKSISPKKVLSPGSPKKFENDKTVPTTEPTNLSQEKSVSPKKGPGPGFKLDSDKTEPITGPTQISQENSVSPKKVPSPGSAKKLESDKTEPTKISQENSISPKKALSPRSAKKLENDKTVPTTEPTKLSQEKSISPKKGPGPGSKLDSDKAEPITGPIQISQENSVSPKKVPSPGSAKKFENEKIEPTKISQEKSISPKKVLSPGLAKKIDNDEIEPTTESTKISQEKSISPKKGPGPGSKLVSDKTEPITGPTQISQENSVSPKKVPSPESAKKLESDKTEPTKISQEKSISPKKVPRPRSAKKVDNDKIEPATESTKISQEKIISPKRVPSPRLAKKFEKEITEDLEMSPKGFVNQAFINAINSLAKKSGSPKDFTSEPSTEKSESPKDRIQKSSIPKGVNEPIKISRVEKNEKSSPNKSPSSKSASPKTEMPQFIHSPEIAV